LHNNVEPSLVASPCRDASAGAGPQVPSALQKPDAQSLSIVQLSLDPPPHAALMLQSSMNVRHTQDDMRERYARGPEAVKPVFAVQQKACLQCSEPARKVPAWRRS
jgi:hypothetical protein